MMVDICLKFYLVPSLPRGKTLRSRVRVRVNWWPSIAYLDTSGADVLCL